MRVDLMWIGSSRIVSIFILVLFEGIRKIIPYPAETEND